MIKASYLSIPKMETKKVWSGSSVRNMCINNDYYSSGTNSDYCELLQFVDENAPTEKNIYAVAFDIVLHTDLLDRYGCTMPAAIEAAMDALNNEAIRTITTIDRTLLED